MSGFPFPRVPFPGNGTYFEICLSCFFKPTKTFTPLRNSLFEEIWCGFRVPGNPNPLVGSVPRNPEPRWVPFSRTRNPVWISNNKKISNHIVVFVLQDTGCTFYFLQTLTYYCLTSERMTVGVFAIISDRNKIEAWGFHQPIENVKMHSVIQIIIGQYIAQSYEFLQRPYWYTILKATFWCDFCL